MYKPSYSNIANTYGSNVVMLTNDRTLSSGGTGFVFNLPDGGRAILTNAHVCGISEKGLIYATTSKGETFSTRVLYSDRKKDLCVVKMPYNLRQPGLTIAADAASGDSLYVVGYPLLEARRVVTGHFLKEETISVAYAVTTEQEVQECIDTDGTAMDGFFGSICFNEFESFSTEAQIYPGNSGSPVLNTSGNVIGVVFAGSGATGYAVPLYVVREFLEDFKVSKNGKNSSKKSYSPGNKSHDTLDKVNVIFNMLYLGFK